MTDETRPQKDTRLSCAAAELIIDERNIRDSKKVAEIMTTLEQTIAIVLIMLYGNGRTAAAILNQALLEGVEYRLTLYDKPEEKTR